MVKETEQDKLQAVHYFAAFDEDYSNLTHYIRADLVYRLIEAATEAREAILKRDEMDFGVVFDTPDKEGWFIRDELAKRLNAAIELIRGTE